MGQLNFTTTSIPGGGVGSQFGSARRRFAVLDRDGTINAEREYLSSPDQVELLPRVSEGLRLLRDLGLRMIVVTNQSGVGRGYYNMAQVEETHTRLRELLAADQVELDGIYVCPHAPEDGCNCRKPRTGPPASKRQVIGIFALRKVLSLAISPAISTLARLSGRRPSSFAPGTAAVSEVDLTVPPDLVADDLFEAAELIGRQLGMRCELDGDMPILGTAQ